MIMEYLLKASAVTALFYLLYKLFLQRETFFQTNRLYLLIGLVTAICLPLIVIPIYVEYTPIVSESIIPTTTIIDSQESTNVINFDIWEVLFTIYGLGVALFFGKLLIELTSLKFLFNKHNYYKSDSYTFIETDNNIPPFSFFNWIVFNPKKYSKEELQHILNHEKIHAKEYHSIDIMITQLACILLWFNPFIWLYKKEIQQNLEFIADNKAQNFADCEKSYQLILLKSSVAKHKFLITNNFYNSQIKKRIIMLHKSKSSKVNAWKYALTLPVLALFLMSFNTKQIFIEAEIPEDLSSIPQTEASVQLNSFYTTVDSYNNNDDSKTKKETATVKNRKNETDKVTVQAHATPNKTKAKGDVSITVIDKNTTDGELDKIQDRLKKEGLTVKFKSVKRNSKGEITAIKITAKSENSNASYNVNSDEAIDPIKIIYDESNNSISIGNGHAKHGKNTYVYENHQGSKYKIHKSGSGSNVFVISDDDHEEHEGNDHETKIIVRSNGKKGKVKTIKRSKNVEVISGDDDTVEIIVDEEGDNEKEVIIVNGKRINTEEGEDNIIIKGKSKKVWISDDDGNEDIIMLQNAHDDGNVFISTNNGKDPLYIIDGKEVSKEKLVKTNPKNIESVTVLKDKNAIEKYGKKGKDGVIIIKTKKNKN